MIVTFRLRRRVPDECPGESREEPCCAAQAPRWRCRGSRRWRPPLPPTPRHALRTAAAHGLHVHAQRRAARTTGRPPGDGEDYEITPHLKPLEEPQGRLHAARESLEREDRRAQRPLAQSAGVAFRRLCGAHFGRRSRFRRHFRGSVRRAADRRPHHAAELRTRPRSHAHRHRYRRRRLRAHVRLLHLLARPAHARSPRRSFRNWRSTACSAPTRRRWSRA